MNERNYLPKKALKHFIIFSICLSIFMYIFIGLILLIININIDDKVLLILLDSILIVLLLFLILSNIIFPIIYYKSYSYIVYKDKIIINFGVFQLHNKLIPIKRIQHLEIIRGPVQRILGLSNLVIFTAGSSASILSIDKNKAEELLEYIRSLLDIKLNANE